MITRHGKTFAVVDSDFEPSSSKRRRAPTGQRFALLTEERLKLLAGLSGAAWAIYCYLLKINWKDLNQPVKLTNGALAEIGVSPDAKLRALPQLKRAGLVKVKKAGNQALAVTPLK
jgi:DNA-binding transcriptional ArsR family regulator